MSIQRVETISYGVDDIGLCTRFLENWGLEKVEISRAGATFRTPENQIIILRLIDDEVLPPTSDRNSTAREVIWGVEKSADIDKIGAELTKDRSVTLDTANVLRSRDDSGNHIGFMVSQASVSSVRAKGLNFHKNIGPRNIS